MYTWDYKGIWLVITDYYFIVTVRDRDVADGRTGSTSRDNDRGPVSGASHLAEIHKATSKTSVFTSSAKVYKNKNCLYESGLRVLLQSTDMVMLSMECPLCLSEQPSEVFCELASCGHRACLQCLQQYLRVEITESRVCISCPECSESLHPNGEYNTCLLNGIS